MVEGYTFKEWNTKKDGTGTSYNINDSYDANSSLELYAIWDNSDSEGISAADVKANPMTYYGEYVDYIPKNGCDVGWRIFYADDTNIYLISDNYVQNSYLTATGLTNSKDTTNNYKYYCVYSSKNRADLIERLSNESYYTGFKDSAGKALSAVGGPTIEQFIVSYNATHDVGIDIKKVKKGEVYAETNTAEADGYVFRFIDKPNYEGYTIHILNKNGNLEDLYVMKSDYYAKGYWLKSFSTWYTDAVMEIYYSGEMDCYSCNDTCVGIRPLLTLNSNVRLVDKNEDGVWELN